MCLAIHDPSPTTITQRMTYEDFRFWERMYEADPWGELRQDMRMQAHIINTHNPQTDVSMFFNYFASEEAELERNDELHKRKAEMLSSDEIAAKLARGKEMYLAEKARKANG